VAVATTELSVPAVPPRDAPAHDPFAVRPQGTALALSGELRLADASRLWKRLMKLTRTARPRQLDLDLRDVTFVDGAVMALLVELRSELVSRGVACEIVGASDRFQALIALYGGDAAPAPVAEPRRAGALEEVGAFASGVGVSVISAIQFLGDLVSALWGVLRRPATGNWRAIITLSERAGADGVPIIVLLNFLVGFVMAYQSSHQLEIYGANVFVADVVGISITRELAPLMTAIIVSGRSGAAFAAELGTMKVSEEIDALRTMGFAPSRYLVLPRVAALALVTPVLTLLGDVVGVAGGAVVGALSLGVSPRAYLAELQTAVFGWDLGTGLFKSVAFGIAIAVIGCRQGFKTHGGAAGVGRGTTTTVVLCLFAIVLLDTLFTVFFRMLRL
jgi:phospholipid/cholesterol/gamma-HCH transport system permease protein